MPAPDPRAAPLPEDIAAALHPLLMEIGQAQLGVAVSGGGDSMALFHALSRCLGPDRLAVATVDHGLRRESAAEAAWVKAEVTALGHRQSTLSVALPPRGNRQAEARSARRRVLAAWAAEEGIGHIALGHTLDDQAETVLMRLERGSGVAGLAGMPGRLALEGGPVFHRPFLGLTRARLRAFLEAAGRGWCEDPSNADPRSLRIRTRAAIAAFGLSAPRLVATAERMALAEAVLTDAAEALWAEAGLAHPLGWASLALAPLARAREETRLRLLAACLAWVSGSRTRPRFQRLRAIAAALIAGDEPGATLHGAILRRRGPTLLILREPAATGPAVPLGRAWDGRWQSAQAEVEGVTLAALARASAEARAAFPPPPDTPREAYLSSPGVFRAGRLVAAPLAITSPNFSVSLLKPRPNLRPTGSHC